MMMLTYTREVNDYSVENKEKYIYDAKLCLKIENQTLFWINLRPDYYSLKNWKRFLLSMQNNKDDKLDILVFYNLVGFTLKEGTITFESGSGIDEGLVYCHLELPVNNCIEAFTELVADLTEKMFIVF